MKQEFEFRPFDRVTVKAFNKEIRAVFLCKQESRTGSYYVCAFGDGGSSVDGIGALPDEIRPGHYDAAGNWLPSPGDPCFFIDSESGKPVQVYVMEFYDGENMYIAHTVQNLPSGGRWYEAWRVNKERAIMVGYEDILARGEEISSLAILYPGRIKTAE